MSTRWFVLAVLLLGATGGQAAEEPWEPSEGPAREAHHEEDFVGGWSDDDDLYEPAPDDPASRRPARVRDPSGPASKAHSPIRLSGVLFDGRVTGEPDPEEAIRLTNTDLERAIDIGDFGLSDRFGPPRNTVAPPHSDSNAPRFVSFPSGTRIPAGGELWVAHDGDAFTRLFGFRPDFEGTDTRSDVPQLEVRTGWPTWNSLRGVVSLHDAYGNVVDLVAYDRSKAGDGIDKFDIPRGSWNGPSVLLFHASPFGWTGQILARDRDSSGRLLPDTDTAADWDSGFSRHALGLEPLHRVEFPGQSRFVFDAFEDDAEVVCASAPENAYSALEKTIAKAKREILVRIYQWENDHVADLLIAAKQRGVKVVAYLEGSPVGGMPDQERYITDRLERAGIPVYFLITNDAKAVRNRYRFDHSKYLVIDGETVMIGTENFGYTGHPLDPTFGNRGWMVHVTSKKLAAQLRSVWDDDLDPKRHADIVGLSDDPADTWGLPYRKPPFHLRRAVVAGSYDTKRPPLRVKGKVGLELVVCPDNCLAEDRALIGLIKGAKKDLLVLQNSIPLWWGQKATGSVETTPNLPLMAVVEAARRGVRVRVLLDGTWYNAEPYDPRDNDDTVRFLNELAHREGLDLEAKVVNLVSTGLEKIHAKGVIADGRRVFVGSINWTENSFKANREVGVVVDHPEVATYYATLFLRDWAMTRLYRVVLGPAGGPVRVRPAGESTELKRAKAGDVLEVMAENNRFLEVRISEKATGYLPMTAVEEILAVPEETPALVGRAARVRGRVREAHVAASGVYLNFGMNWRSDFSVFIPRSAVGAFQRAGIALPAAFDGREIEVRGELVEKDGPMMKLETPALVRVVK